MKKRLLVCLLSMTCLLLGACAAAQQTLTIQFFDVGKADAMLIITPSGQTILIDTATNKEGKKLVERFKEMGIERIDVLIVTHYDKDHVGGADKILEEFPVGRVYMPVYDKDSKQYEQFEEALLENAPGQVVRMKQGSKETFEIGGVQLELTAAQRSFYGEDEENDFSLCVRMRFGQTRFLFPGDAEKARQMEILGEGNVACDVLKVPYHGRLTDASAAFIAQASPQIAFVPDDEEEPGSPAVYEMLHQAGAQVYSAQQGDLTVLSDGQRVWVQP